MLIDANETLVFPEEASNKPWLNSAFPLHILAINGDPADITQLLLAGEDVNKEDFLSTRPLHVAALSGNIEAVQLFLDYGAEVNDDSYYGITALYLALQQEHYDIARLLIAHGADLNAGEKEYGETPFFVLADHLDNYINDYLDDRSPEALQKIEQVAELFQLLDPNAVFSFSHDDVPLITVIKSCITNLPDSPVKTIFQDLLPVFSTDYENAYVNAKLLLHVFPTGNVYHYTFDGVEHSLNSEGFFGIYTTMHVNNALHAYVDETHSELFSKIEHTYELATTLTWNTQDPATHEMTLNAYHEGQTILIPSGWDGHFVNIILSEPQMLFACANSGQRYYEYDAGVRIYKMYDPDLIDTDFIHDVSTNTQQNNLEYNLVYQYGLLESSHFLPGDNQQFGNCALQSHREAVRGLLYIELLNEGVSSTEATLKAEEYFQDWNAFLGEYTVETYFSNSDQILPIDAYLDILKDLNTDPLTLTQSDINVLQTFQNAVLTPEHQPEFDLPPAPLLEMPIIETMA